MRRFIYLLLLIFLKNPIFGQSDTISPSIKLNKSINSLMKNSTNKDLSNGISTTLRDLADYASFRMPSLSMKDIRRGVADTSTAVYVNDMGRAGIFLYDKTDNTSKDDSAMVIKVGNKRYLRQNDGFINVKWFGAKGDGVTDDTRAIQAAIDYLNPSDQPVFKFEQSVKSGGTVYLPAGTYIISKTLWLSNSVKLLGNTGISPYSNRFVKNNKGSASIIRGNFDHDAFMIQTQSWRTKDINLKPVTPSQVAYDESTHWRQSDAKALSITSGASIENLILLNGGSHTWGGIRFCSSTYGTIKNVEVSQSKIGLLLDCALFNTVEDIHINARVAGLVVSESSISTKISRVYINSIDVTTWSKLKTKVPPYLDIDRHRALKTSLQYASSTLRVAIFLHGANMLHLDNICIEGWEVGIVNKLGNINANSLYFEDIKNTAIICSGGQTTLSSAEFVGVKYLYGIDEYVNLTVTSERNLLPPDGNKTFTGYEEQNPAANPTVKINRPDDIITRQRAKFIGNIGLPSFLKNTDFDAFKAGNANAASYVGNNVYLQLTKGLGFQDNKGNVNGYYDAAIGKFDVKNGYYINGIKLQASSSANTASAAKGQNPTKAEFDALLKELRDLKEKLKAAQLLAQ
jgi:hypothetical protein